MRCIPRTFSFTTFVVTCLCLFGVGCGSERGAPPLQPNASGFLKGKIKVISVTDEWHWIGKCENGTTFTPSGGDAVDLGGEHLSIYAEDDKGVSKSQACVDKQIIEIKNVGRVKGTETVKNDFLVKTEKKIWQISVTGLSTIKSK
jgi:hypothetical protein